MNVTLRDIANHINVSASTVSRALNDQQYVNEATRRLVLQAAEELGYPLDNLRRSAKMKSSVLLLLTRGTSLQKKQPSGVFGREESLVMGAQATLDQYGVITRIQQTHGDEEEVALYVDDPTLAGLILMGGMIQPGFVRRLQNSGLPFVVAGAGVKSLEVNCVTADYSGGAEQAVAHLAAVGRQRIGMVNSPSVTISSAEKLRGFRLALSLNDLPFAPNQVVESDFDVESGYTQTLQLLEQVPNLDAIVYGGDDIAMGGLHALKEQGKQIPDDVAVIGYYDHGIARFTDPSLTSVQVDLQRISRLAAHRLHMLLDKPDDEVWSIVTPTSLVIRNSA